MRRWLALTAALCLALTIPMPAAAGGTSDPFGGAWKAIDLDGSAMTLAISGGGPTRHVVIVDVSCGACNPSGYPTVMIGTGEVINDTLYGSGTWHDAPGSNRTDVWYFEITYAEGTLTGPFEIQWSRAGN